VALTIDGSDPTGDLGDLLASKADLALPANAQDGSGASAYTFVLADASRLTTATNASAKTFTIPPQSSVVWPANSIIRVVNYGAGVLTVSGGSGVTVTNTAKTIGEFESAAAIRTGSDAWTLVPFGGGLPKASVSSTTGSPVITSVGSDTLYSFNSGSGSITLNNADPGLVQVLVVAGGGGSAGTDGSFGCGVAAGKGGEIVERIMLLPAGSYSLSIGGGGGASSNSCSTQGAHGGNSTFDRITCLGGQGGRRSGGFAGSATGISSSIVGSSVFYGKNGSNLASPSNGAANSGNGGDCFNFNSPASAGRSGGSGVVIVRVAT
jgi:hypothetical protein